MMIFYTRAEACYIKPFQHKRACDWRTHSLTFLYVHHNGVSHLKINIFPPFIFFYLRLSDFKTLNVFGSFGMMSPVEGMRFIIKVRMKEIPCCRTSQTEDWVRCIFIGNSNVCGHSCERHFSSYVLL